MHHAKLTKSIRLKALYDVLRRPRPRWLSTLDLIQLTGLCAISAAISELRRNRVDGRRVKIDCNRVGRVYYYRLAV